MRGIGRATVVGGGLLVLGAWAAAWSGVLAAHRPVTDVLAEVSAALLVILAWRFRRDRLAVAAVIIAVSNLLLRTVLAAPEAAAGRTVLALSVVADLALLAAQRDRPLASLPIFLWSGVVALQVWFAVSGVGLLVPEPAVSRMTAPWTVGIVFGLAGAAVVVAFALRRGAFEASLLPVLVACALAFPGRGGPDLATLSLAAGQLVLLAGLIGDSYRLAYHDELTGLPGRRSLEEAMQALNGTFTIAMADIDRFKLFNDRYGHDAGDQALRMVADELRRAGGGGRAYRYGGEEFAILFAGRRAADARSHLEELRTAVEDRKFALRGPDRPRAKPDRPGKKARPPRRVTVTVSIGAADSTTRTAAPAGVLRAADRALYRAKGAGRNRVVIAGDRLA
jgi:diguanylate cyclase (GGDEF)-like protein